MRDSDAVVVDVPEHARYEMATNAGPAVVAYDRQGSTLVLTHTGVPPEMEGHGVGSELVAGVLADVRRQGLKIVPQCRFVAAYLQRHPDQADLVA
jgi:hypothetical protein